MTDIEIEALATLGVGASLELQARIQQGVPMDLPNARLFAEQLRALIPDIRFHRPLPQALARVWAKDTRFAEVEVLPLADAIQALQKDLDAIYDLARSGVSEDWIKMARLRELCWDISNALCFFRPFVRIQKVA